MAANYPRTQGCTLISVRPIAPHEWQKYRDIRLQALQDAPGAFGSTWAAEATQADEHWSTRIAAAAASDMDRALFAVKGEVVCGLVWCKLSAAEPGVADIYQMWVAPTARGMGPAGPFCARRWHGQRTVEHSVSGWG